MKITTSINETAFDIDVPFYTPCTDVLRMLAHDPAQKPEYPLVGTCIQINPHYCSGHCMLLYNEIPTCSCMLTAHMLAQSTIITADMVQQSPIMKKIEQGFARADLQCCSYCLPARIIISYSLSQVHIFPSMETLNDIAQAIRCTCVSHHYFKNALQEIMNI